VVASLQNHPFSFALRGRAIPGQVPRLPGTARFFFLKMGRSTALCARRDFNT
jgi:hypothetical protein